MFEPLWVLFYFQGKTECVPINMHVTVRAYCQPLLKGSKGQMRSTEINCTGIVGMEK